jgi:hypothetical protein
MVTTSLGRAAGQGYVKGLTLGIIDAAVPKPLFQGAAAKYLSETGRSHCRINDGYLLVEPQYEFKFACYTVGRDKKEAPSVHRKEPFTPYVEPDLQEPLSP